MTPTEAIARAHDAARDQYRHLATKQIALDMLEPLLANLPTQATIASQYDIGVSKAWSPQPGEPRYSVTLDVTIDYDADLERMNTAKPSDWPEWTVNDLPWRTRVRPIGATFRALKARPRKNYDGQARTVDEEGTVKYLFQSDALAPVFSLTGYITVKTGGISPACTVEYIEETVDVPAHTETRKRVKVTCPEPATPALAGISDAE